MNIKTGAVSAVIAAGTSTTLNVDAGGGDGIVGVAIPGWYDPVQGDVVQIADYLSTGVWEVTRCLSRGGLLQPVLPVIPRLLAGPPAGVPAGAVDSSAIKIVDDHTWYAVYSTTAPTPPPATGGPLVIPPLSSDTWDPTNGWDSRSDEVRQGDYRDSSIHVGAATGCYFYNNLAAALAGKTVTGLSVHIERADRRGGIAGGVPMRLALHGAATAGNGQPPIVAGPQDGPTLSWGGEADCPLPVQWGQMLAAGQAAGVCITSAAQSDYAICLGASGGSGALLFTVV